MPKKSVGAAAAAGDGGASSSSSSSSSDMPLSLATSILHPEKCFFDPYNALSTPLYQVRRDFDLNSGRLRNTTRPAICF